MWLLVAFLREAAFSRSHEEGSNARSHEGGLFSIDLRKVHCNVIHGTVNVGFGICDVGLELLTHFIETENLNRTFPEF